MCLYRWGQLDSSAFYLYIFVIVIKYSMLVMSPAVAHDNYYGRFPHQNQDGHARRQGCATDCVPPFITHVSFSSIYPNKFKKKLFRSWIHCFWCSSHGRWRGRLCYHCVCRCTFGGKWRPNRNRSRIRCSSSAF